jgi:uncharacterized damage-inducible protein DinB
MSMLNLLQIKTLFAYHWHTARRLMDCAAKLNEADYTAQPGYGHGSIHDILFHVMRADRSWRLSLQTGMQPPPLNDEDCRSLISLQSFFEQEQSAWDSFLEALTSEEIEANAKLTTARGNVREFPRWRVLQHLVLHGMQHFSEVAQLLTAYGQSPGDIDFIFFRG